MILPLVYVGGLGFLVRHIEWIGLRDSRAVSSVGELFQSFNNHIIVDVIKEAHFFTN